MGGPPSACRSISVPPVATISVPFQDRPKMLETPRSALTPFSWRLSNIEPSGQVKLTDPAAALTGDIRNWVSCGSAPVHVRILETTVD